MPPEIESLDEYLKPIFDYLSQNSQKGDFAFISGDFGATYKCVNFSKNINLLAVYATTKREVFEVIENGEVKKISKFRHVRFRRYF
ncbi:MAG: hypothetical protein HXX81_04740 [Campylobacterales bacterium]|nr:hypothetical protein [Campylobacterales bacterium]